jgi:molybdate transport system substrate-binding protein
MNLTRASFLGGAAAAAVLPAPARAQQTTLTVFAAASLRDAFNAIGTAFSRASGTAVRLNLAGSDALATQILQGAPADVFASANVAQMMRVQSAGLLAADPRVFARNLIVVITLAGATKVRSIAALADPGVKVVLAAPTVPIGKYARDALAAMASDPAYGAGFAERVERNVVSNEADVKAVATKVALGEADAGVVYATDASGEIGGRVRVLPIPGRFAKPAIYPIAPLKGKNDAAARAFVDYALSSAGSAILQRAGFLPP